MGESERFQSAIVLRRTNPVAPNSWINPLSVVFKLL